MCLCAARAEHHVALFGILRVVAARKEEQAAAGIVHQRVRQQRKVGAGAAVFADRAALLQQKDLRLAGGEVERIGFLIHLIGFVEIVLFRIEQQKSIP